MRRRFSQEDFLSTFAFYKAARPGGLCYCVLSLEEAGSRERRNVCLKLQEEEEAEEEAGKTHLSSPGRKYGTRQFKKRT